MSASIIQFPDRPRPQNIQIPLYTDEEIAVTLAAINVCGKLKYRVDESDLKHLDAGLVFQCLMLGRLNTVFSTSSRNLIKKILSNIQSVQTPKP